MTTDTQKMKTSLVVAWGEPKVVVEGTLSVADIRERVGAFEALFGADSHTLQLNGTFVDKRHNAIFAGSHPLELLEAKTKWLTCRIDGALVDVQPSEINPAVRLEIRWRDER
jgi:hypothetical protein